MEQEALSGIVFDIERFSTHDGPGIRTVVFLKGCPLRCQWCASPESQSPAPQMGFLSEICAGCGRCIDPCPQGDYFRTEGKPAFFACDACFQCVDACLANARVVYGTRMSVEEVVSKVKEDMLFYRKSHGGVTMTGGEVCLQADFAAAVLRECREAGIHTAIETCGFAKWEKVESVVRQVDYLMYDFKHMDSAVHKHYTGVGNEQILENAVRASEIVPEMVVRMPVIPGVNDSAENVTNMGAFIRQHMPRVNRVDLLPYHSIGESKGRHIGKAYPFKPPYELDAQRLEMLKTILKDSGFDARLEK